MPIDYKKYQPNWKKIREEILKRAGDKCELCFVPNRYTIYRTKHGWLLPEYNERLEGKKVNIVLTIHHINFDLGDNHPLNLIALCQRCHLRLDIREKLRKRKTKKQGD